VNPYNLTSYTMFPSPHTGESYNQTADAVGVTSLSWGEGTVVEITQDGISTVGGEREYRLYIRSYGLSPYSLPTT
jgi:hypothetical protein